MQSEQTTPPKRIWADPPETFDGMDIWRSEPGGRGVEYILASEHAALIREAEAERDEAQRLMQMRHREMLAADELMRKHQGRAVAAEADRDRLAAANAVLEAKVAGLVEAVKPFDAVGGTLFSKNWNMSDIVFDGGPMRSDCLFFEDFLNLRAALATQEAGT